ncbi:hypothetical protein AOB46_09855 [Chryseobacterium indologenes]|uniref:Uncharacterized protein n=1 Tax=Chryseobacterium indologenes TaxID=253 RepID=A0A0N1KSI8_CHRID|nr:hypothetical protein AOB46_09855 [Chryseobacterium indologenes]
MNRKTIEYNFFISYFLSNIGYFFSVISFSMKAISKIFRFSGKKINQKRPMKIFMSLPIKVIVMN